MPRAARRARAPPVHPRDRARGSLASPLLVRHRLRRRAAPRRPMNRAVIGWDVGGVNTKIVRVARGKVLGAHAHPYEIQRDPDALVPLLRTLAREIGADETDVHALTMTAELSQMFRTKREGVCAVLDAVGSAFPHSAVYVYTVDGC